MTSSPIKPSQAIPTIVDHTEDRDGEIAERRPKPSMEQVLRSRIQDKKISLPTSIQKPQKKQATGAPKVPKLLSPKTPKTVLNRQKQLAISNRRSLHFVQDVLLMAQYLAGVLATALVGYGIGSGFAAYTTGSYTFAANAGMALLLLGGAWYSYRRFVRPADYLVNAGLSYACAVQRAVAKSQESEGTLALELPQVHPNHPITYLRVHYVAYVMGYMRFVLFTQPLLMFVAGLSVLVTAAFHQKWYIWSIGACFVTMGSLWFVTVWTLYMWLKRKCRRMSSQFTAFFAEFLPPKVEKNVVETAKVDADADTLHSHAE